MPTNFEFKASCADLPKAEATLLKCKPLFTGEDHQIDTYFNVAHGRMKLREGNIENALIHYQRTNSATAKQSDVLLYQHKPHATLKQILTTALGIKAIVQKKRKIYFIDNVKFHFDEVNGLGSFIEVEAIDQDGSIGIEKLKEQCSYYAELLGVREDDYLANSYSDMLLEKNPH
jgi:adenylate cyclase, class 2